MGIGALQQQQLWQQQQMQQAQQGQAPATPPAGAAAAAAMADVMTPAQAAAILQVSEQDVVAAIEAGDLKAKKIGAAYRISKTNLEEFLAG
jgi:excisionase family DNA binding protein